MQGVLNDCTYALMSAFMSMITALSPNELSPEGINNDAALPHVLLVLDQFPKTLGGGERIVLKLAALLPQVWISRIDPDLFGSS